jgi:FkbM family methyltransferase
MGKTESIRLDTFLKYIEHINLIKIDVEGAELMVLEGLENIINKVDYILVECHLNKD